MIYMYIIYIYIYYFHNSLVLPAFLTFHWGPFSHVTRHLNVFNMSFVKKFSKNFFFYFCLNISLFQFCKCKSIKIECEWGLILLFLYNLMYRTSKYECILIHRDNGFYNPKIHHL